MLLVARSSAALSDAPAASASSQPHVAMRSQSTSMPVGNEPPADAPTATLELSNLRDVPKGFNSFDGGWIRFWYHPDIRRAVQPLIDRAVEIRRDLAARLGQAPATGIRVRIARTPGEMEMLAPEGVPFPSYASGVAYPEIGLILLTAAPVNPNSRHNLEEIFRHEMAHVALWQAVGGRAVPRWFNEGFAVFASGESSFVRLQTLWTATLADSLLPIERLERTFPADATSASVAYAEAADLLRFLVRQQDRIRFVTLIERLKSGQTLSSAMLDAYNSDPNALEQEWRQDIARRYTFWPVVLSGTVVWVGIIGLFVWAWRRRRRRDRQTLARWAREEAAEEMQKAAAAAQASRVHIVLAAPTQRGAPPLRPPIPESGIPKVEHEGQWHTLH
ncbi:MAG TPA: peptidase MA family metallohydrolase [Polyangiaceae bacterium]